MPSHFDLFAAMYNRVVGAPHLERLQALLGLPTAGWLVDVGGGTGRVSAAWAPRVGGLVVSDLSRPMLQQAARLGSLYAIQARAEELPLGSGSISRLLVVDALHHFARQREALAELWRVLAPGGRLVIEEPDIRRPSVKLGALAETLTLMRSRFHTAEAIRVWLQELGAETTLESDGRNTVWIVATK